MSYRFSSIFDSAKTLNMPMKYPIAFIIVIGSCQAYAAPQDMGTITVTSRSLSNGTASGTYIAAGSGATGSFTLTRINNNTRGYLSNVEIKPTGLPATGTNGIEISNLADTNVSNDKFTYTFTITPNDNTAIHTIKIGQASYTTSGNSEVAQHTLNFTKSTLNSRAVQASVRTNPSVPYYYEAMGDYFMGKRDPANTNNFIYNDPQPHFNYAKIVAISYIFIVLTFLTVPIRAVMYIDLALRVERSVFEAVPLAFYRRRQPFQTL